MRYDILKDFKGSQTGATAEQFTAGQQADLSDYLVACVDPSWIRPAADPSAPTIDNKAIATDGGKPAKKPKKGDAAAPPPPPLDDAAAAAPAAPLDDAAAAAIADAQAAEIARATATAA